jgi:hypothetical protein
VYARCELTLALELVALPPLKPKTIELGVTTLLAMHSALQAARKEPARRQNLSSWAPVPKRDGGWQ